MVFHSVILCISVISKYVSVSVFRNLGKKIREKRPMLSVLDPGMLVILLSFNLFIKYFNVADEETNE